MVCACAAAWCAAIPTPGQTLPPWTEGTFDIHRISTGKGDAVFYIFPDGTTMLADPGATDRQGPRVTAPRPDGSRRPGEWVARYIRRIMPQASGGALDYALLTHFHGDHMGDLMAASPPAASGAYKLTGITDTGDAIPIRRMLDRGWPDYAYPAPLDGSMMQNYRAFLAWQARNRGLKAERFQPGRKDQVALVHAPARYPGFEFRNVAANGEIWTGVDTNTRQHFPRIRDLKPGSLPSENMCSIGFRISYGRFDYFCGGDMPGVPEEWAPAWQDVETPVARAVGPVEVSALNHHGYLDSTNAFFVSTLRARVWLFSVWSSSHPDARALRRLLSTELYPGPRDIFATNMMEANEVVIEALDKLAGRHGHILVRVAPGGGSYSVIVLDDADETFRVKAVHGPYESR